MNVFEDLLDELKEEHLIEETSADRILRKTPPVSDNSELINLDLIDGPDTISFEEESATLDILSQNEIFESEKFLDELGSNAPLAEHSEPETEIQLDLINPPPAPQKQKAAPKRKLTEFEKFRKNAMEEVSSLQMVDNIFTSVEREQMKVLAKPFDDLPVKQVLHSLLQLEGEIAIEQQKHAEAELRRETGAWKAALDRRDESISVENLRYCCENSRPPLSPPALLALAKYYRNKQFSESIRNKFDLVITRLFSSDIDDNKRELVFTRDELIEHLAELYAEWGSPPPSDPENEEIVARSVSRLQELAREVYSTNSFDELIESQYFTRVRALKRSTADNFFAPEFAATSIICNVEVGNRYLDLLRFGQERSFAETIEDKYSFLFDQSISETTKSVEIVEILKALKENSKHPAPAKKTQKVQNAAKSSVSSKARRRESVSSKFQWLYGINKGILAMTVISVLLTAGLYVWVEFLDSPRKASANVITVDLEKSPLKKFVESAKVSNETLFAITTEEFAKLPREEKENVITKLLADGAQKGYRKVHVLDQNSMTIGSGSENGIELR